MAAPELATKLTGLLRAPAEANGFDLVCVETAGQAKSPLVRVYLDREDGLGIEDITAANEWIMAVLDVVPETAADYTLEVSSPGIERPLVTLDHFRRFIGSDAKVQTSGPVEGRKHFTGRIDAVEGDSVVMTVDGTTYTVPHAAISKARLRVEIDFAHEEGTGS
jgi:ribosome maturation factor RimP